VEKIAEFPKANLSAIVEQLEMCGYTSEGGPLENNVAFIELKRIANDKHDVVACLANYFHGLDLTRSVSYITSDDIGRPILDDQIIKVTTEYAPLSECSKQ